MSGIALPPLLAAMTTPAGWRWGWVLLAVLSAVALVASVPAAFACREPPAPPAASRRWPVRRLLPVMTSYALFGVATSRT